jgi:hypothetical protein
LRKQDYSQWLHEAIKDDALSRELRTIELDKNASAADSRARVIKVLEQHYTAPA